MAKKRVAVTSESDTGRNLKFRDNHTGAKMTRNQFVGQIQKGEYPKYHVRNVHGLKTPVSNPDKSTNNNLD